MTFLLLIYRSLRQHLLSTLVTAGSIALATGLLLTVWVVKTQSQELFAQTNSGFDAVLGARGSQLQLVLNSIFHLEASPGNVSDADLQFITHHPLVKTAIPIAVGDNYYGWRIVGTVPELFTNIEYVPGKKYTLARGRLFAGTAKEAVVGSYAAAVLGLKIGDTFHPFHGLNYDPAGGVDVHPDIFTVTGLLAPTNTPVDRVIWIPISGIQHMTGHDPSHATEVSAVLLQLRTPTAGVLLDQMINKQGNRLTFAWPIATIIAGLFNKIGWFDQVLTLVAWLVALVAAASVLASIYNSMSARQRDIAILRALGARRRLVFGAVVAEAGAIGLLGALAGGVVYAGLVTGIAAVIRAQTGVVLEPFHWQPVFLWAPSALVGLCVLGGLVPAVKAYRVPVAETLAPVS
jgi:putative ABC transport system permease protein